MDHSSRYLIQEYQKQNKIDDALDEAFRFLTITNEACKSNLNTKYGKDIVAVKQLRASICTEIATIYASSKQNIEQAIAWAMRAIGEAPEVRDNWLYTAELYLILKKKYMALEFIRFGLQFNTKGSSVTDRFWRKEYIDSLLLRCMQ